MEDEAVLVCSMDYAAAIQCEVMKRLNGGSTEMKRIPDGQGRAILPLYSSRQR